MAKALSDDLRVRVVAAVEAGTSRRQAAAVFWRECFQRDPLGSCLAGSGRGPRQTARAGTAARAGSRHRLAFFWARWNGGRM